MFFSPPFKRGARGGNDNSEITPPQPSPYKGEGENTKAHGLPLGNLTSQLLVNIYLNKFDQFIKHELKIKHYIRYADDFVIFFDDKVYLENLIPLIGDYLSNKLKLALHPDKIFIKTLSSGVDFLGMINFFDHRVLRTKTKRRMLKKLKEKRLLTESGLLGAEKLKQSRQSYLGLLQHCQGYKIKKVISVL